MIVDAYVEGHQHRYLVCLDGVDITNDCYYADDEKGEARLYLRNEQGKFYCLPRNIFAVNDRRRVASVVKHGKVEIIEKRP